jgi:hypothetical protein
VTTLNLLKSGVFFVALSSVAIAQGVDIRGGVADSVTHERIPYANITLVGTGHGASSNVHGFYVVTSVPSGEYQVVVSSIGYQTCTTTIKVHPGDPIVLDFMLVPKAVQMSEVIVTENPRRQLSEIHSSMQILEQKDIHAVPVVAQEDVFRSIGILPGIVSTSDVSSQFYVRGGAGDQNLILLDGMKVYSPYHAFGIYSVLDPDILKTTEVYTGAFPAEYGGRLSSVVNMTTRDGLNKTISGKGSINFLSGKLQLDGPLMPDVSWLVNARKSLFPKTFSKFFTNDLPLSFYDSFMKLTIVAAGFHGKLDFQSFFSGDDLKSSNPLEPDYSWRTSVFGFAASGLVHNRAFVDMVTYSSTFEAHRYSKESPSVTPASTRISETTVRANATFYTDTRDLYFFGFEFSFPSLDYSLVNNAGLPQVVRSTYLESSMWSHYQASLGRLQADIGIYVDLGTLFERGGQLEVVQPRLSLSYQLEGSWRAKIAYGRYTQNMITVNNEDDVIPMFDAWIQVPRGIRSERADHYVVGIDGNVLRNLSTSFQSYYKSYGSLVEYNRDKIDANDPDYVSATGKAYGFESLIRYRNDLLDLYASYTLGWTTIANGGLTYNPRYDRRHTINLLSMVHVLDGFDVSFRWEYGSGLPFTQTVGYFDRLALTEIFRQGFVHQTGDPYSLLGDKDAARLPAYHRLDASATYRFVVRPTRGSIGIHVTNVYDKQNIFYFDRGTGHQINMLPFFPTATLSLEY